MLDSVHELLILNEVGEETNLEAFNIAWVHSAKAILMATLQEKCCHHPHCTGEETEAQGVLLFSQSHAELRG